MLFFRSFHTLPNPMRIRVSLSDLQERKSSLEVSYLNPPLAASLYSVRTVNFVLPSCCVLICLCSQAEKAAKAKLDKFFWVDDAQWQKRFVVGARVTKPEKEEPYKLYIGMSSAHGNCPASPTLYASF
jgi:hypothetical protein